MKTQDGIAEVHQQFVRAKSPHEAISRACAQTGLEIARSYIVTEVNAESIAETGRYSVLITLEALPTCERDELLIAADILEERGMDQASAILRKLSTGTIGCLA